MLLPALTGVFLVLLGARAAADAPPSWRRLKNLVDECAFSVGGISFNLCPVLDANDGGWTIALERKTPPTITKTSYRIDLKAPLKKDSALPGHEQCPAGTWICQTISNRRPRHEDEEERVLQVVPVAGAMSLPKVDSYRPGVNVSAQLAPARDNPKAHVLHIRLHGGYYVYGQQMADFQFLCDPTVDEPSTPAYAWTWNGTHTFQWRTRHACGSQRAKPIPPKDKDKDVPPPEDDSTTPPEGESPDGDGVGLIDGHPMAGRWMRTTMLALLSACTAIVTIAYLVWRPPARVRQYVRKVFKAHPRLARFRVGERVLVRWAYEDMELDDELGYAESEEDTMVNFMEEDEAGEGIPLKPSPRNGSKWTSYGAA